MKIGNMKAGKQFFAIMLAVILAASSMCMPVVAAGAEVEESEINYALEEADTIDLSEADAADQKDIPLENASMELTDEAPYADFNGEEPAEDTMAEIPSEEIGADESGTVEKTGADDEKDEEDFDSNEDQPGTETDTAESSVPVDADNGVERTEDTASIPGTSESGEAFNLPINDDYDFEQTLEENQIELDDDEDPQDNDEISDISDISEDSLEVFSSDEDIVTEDSHPADNIILSTDQIKAVQEKLNIWKYEDRILVSFDSSEEIGLTLRVYDDDTEALLYENSLLLDDQRGCYFAEVEYGALKKSETWNTEDTSEFEKNVKETAIPLRIVLDDGANQYAASISQDIEKITDLYIDTESSSMNEICLRWNRIDVDGYVVYAFSASDENTISVKNTKENETFLQILNDDTLCCFVSAYVYDEEAGIRIFGEASLYTGNPAGERADLEAATEAEETEEEQTDIAFSSYQMEDGTTGDAAFAEEDAENAEKEENSAEIPDEESGSAEGAEKEKGTKEDGKPENAENSMTEASGKTGEAETVPDDEESSSVEAAYAGSAGTYEKREFNGHMYQLFDEGVSWSTAKQSCENKGGHLVTITSSDEYAFCKTLLGDLSPKYCWIGATHSSGSWEWITGETWEFTAWSPNQPNGSGGGTYALMQNFKGVGSAWNWDDQGNSGTSPSSKYQGDPYYHLTKNYCYICEWDNVSISINKMNQAIVKQQILLKASINSSENVPSNEDISWEARKTDPESSGYTIVQWGTMHITKVDENHYSISVPVTFSSAGQYAITASYKNVSDSKELVVLPEKVMNVRWKNNACGHNNSHNIHAVHRKLSLEWDKQEYVHSYKIEISKSIVFTQDLFQTTVYAETEYLDENPRDREVEWYVRVAACVTGNGKEYVGEWSDIFQTQVCSHVLPGDFWGIENDNTHTFPASFAQDFFDPGVADTMNITGTDGKCFGLDFVGLAALYGSEDFLRRWQVNSLSDIDSFDQNREASQLIYKIHTLTGTGIYSGMNELDLYYSRVRAYTEFGGLPVITVVNYCNPLRNGLKWAGVGSSFGSHNIVSLDIVEESVEEKINNRRDRIVKIRVYDSNKSNVDSFIKLIDLYNDGTFDQWEYEWKDAGSSFHQTIKGDRGITYGDGDIGVWINNSYLRSCSRDEAMNMVSLIEEYYLNGQSRESIYQRALSITNGSIDNDSSYYEYIEAIRKSSNNWPHAIEAVVSHSSSSSGTDHLYWIDEEGEEEIFFKDVPIGTQCTLGTSRNVLSVEAGGIADISLQVMNDGNMTVKITPNSKSSFGITLKEFHESGRNCNVQELEVKAPKGKTTIVRRNADGMIFINGSEYISATGNEGTLLSDGYYIYNISESLIARTDSTSQYKYYADKSVAQIINLDNNIITAVSYRSMDKADIDSIPAQEYQGKEINPAFSVVSGNTVLKKGMDYKVSYKNNINAGIADIMITGIGYYTGTKTVSFEIHKAAQSITAKSSASSLSVGGTATVTITGAKGAKSFSSSNTAIATVDKSTGVVTAKKAGTVKIIASVAATANYEAASKTVTIKVLPISISKATVTCPASKVWAGWALTPVPTVKVGNRTLKKGTDFSLSFKNNVHVGKATITITGKGNYTGTYKKTFLIIPKPTTISSISSAKKKLTVKWKKQPSETTGYQIQYSSRSDFKTQKTVTVTGVNTVSKALTGLAGKHKYYVRIRPFKTISGTKYFAAWSAAKSAKTK